MRRRDLLWWLGVLVPGACTFGERPGDPGPTPTGGSDASVDATSAGDAPADACVQAYVTMHDTYAQALYLDGSLGPLTGVVEVEMVIANARITLDFWHGHGGQLHRFTLEPAHFEALKRGERITVGTTTVDGHAHMLFVDPVAPEYRVPGAPDVEVPLGCG